MGDVFLGTHELSFWRYGTTPNSHDRVRPGDSCTSDAFFDSEVPGGQEGENSHDRKRSLRSVLISELHSQAS
jgi:hypothetical protein